MDITDKAIDNKSNSTWKIKNEKTHLSLSLIVKLLALLFIMSLIFFAGLLAYIVFNPGVLIFYTNLFQVVGDDTLSNLSSMIHGTYGTLAGIMVLIVIYLIFHALKEKDRIKNTLISWFSIGLIGLLLFFEVLFWSNLIKIVNFGMVNEDPNVILYDQASYIIDQFRDNSRIYNTKDLIGPIDIFFDLKENATLLARRNQYEFQGFEINFDGAICNNGTSLIKGKNPEIEGNPVCLFDRIKSYNITGNYVVRSPDGSILTIPIKIPIIQIGGVVAIKKEQKDNTESITLDATNLKELGSIEWVFEGGDTVMTGSVISLPFNQNPMRVCLKLGRMSSCNRIFAFGKDN